MICTSCNRDFDRKQLVDGLCQTCLKYFNEGGEINPLPEPGTIGYDNRGYVVCHICGKAYKKLGAHTYQMHDLLIKEYKELFGLCNNTKTTERTYSQTMRNYAYQYNMPEQLRITGANTRVKPGDTHLRLGKTLRLQEKMRLARMSRQNAQIRSRKGDFDIDER